MAEKWMNREIRRVADADTLRLAARTFYIDGQFVGLRTSHVLRTWCTIPGTYPTHSTSSLGVNLKGIFELSGKVAVILGYGPQSTSQWQATGGNWFGYVNEDINWRTCRPPTESWAAMGSAFIDQIWCIKEMASSYSIPYSKIVVSFWNEPRYVVKVNSLTGNPSGTIATTYSAGTNTILVNLTTGLASSFKDSNRGAVLIGTYGGSATQLYVTVTSAVASGASQAVLTLGSTLSRTVSGGETISTCDWEDFTQLRPDETWWSMASAIIPQIKAAHPDISIYLGAIHGSKSEVMSRFSHINGRSETWLASAIDGFEFNYYSFSNYSGTNVRNYDYKHIIDHFPQDVRDILLYIKTLSNHGLSTKPLRLMEWGFSSSSIGQSAADIATYGRQKNEYIRGMVVRKVFDKLLAITDLEVACLYSAHGDDYTNESQNYSFIRNDTGNVGSGVPDYLAGFMENTTNTYKTAVPTGYGNTGTATSSEAANPE